MNLGKQKTIRWMVIFVCFPYFLSSARCIKHAKQIKRLSARLTDVEAMAPPEALLVMSLTSAQIPVATERIETMIQKIPHLPFRENMKPPIIFKMSNREPMTNAAIIVPIATPAIIAASSAVTPSSRAACLAASNTTGIPTAVKITETAKAIKERMVAIKIITDQIDFLLPDINRPSFYQLE